jgi:hypothetical protein
VKKGFPSIFKVAGVEYPKRPIDIHKIVCGVQDHHKQYDK